MPVQVQRRRRVLAPGAQPGTARVSAAPAPAVGSGANPWLPWADYGPKASPDRGGVLAIIPTAANDPERLRRCVDALRAASEGVVLRVLLVVCPSTPDKVETARRAAPDADVLNLEGPFNFCRSVNAGIAQLQPDEGYALFLNDDCYFDTPGGLALLKQTLMTQGWCCVGPWIAEAQPWNAEARMLGPERRQKPNPGTCVLWDRAWLERVGTLDEAFGDESWGEDEADLSYRALRLGATWGREGRVQAAHDGHATFGAEYARWNSPAGQKSLQAWRRKYGPEVGCWGGTIHWEPLPGVQVAIAGHNVAPWLERCLDSVEAALSGYRWILTYADDASTDGSLEIARAHHSGADQVIIRQFDKAQNAGMAKNRAIALGNELRDTYSALCLMDADDVMGVERINHTLWQTRDGGYLVTHGEFRHIATLALLSGRAEFVPPIAPRQQLEGWLHPCTTIIHRSLIPADGRLFDEDVPICEDALLFLQWYLRGIQSVPLPGPVVHNYYLRPNSVMNNSAGETRDREMVQYFVRRSRLLEQYVTK